jgi:hypothetical protein
MYKKTEVMPYLPAPSTTPKLPEGVDVIIRRVFRNGKWFRFAVPIKESKYKSHQGRKEKERRIRKGENR